VLVLRLRVPLWGGPVVVAVRVLRAQQAQLPTAAVLGGQVQLMAPQEQLTLAVVVVVHTPEPPETAVQGL
jgi:hypothetical protein